MSEPLLQNSISLPSGDAVGIIAGNGEFPLACARYAKLTLQKKVFIAAHIGEASPEIEQYADKIIWIKVGQLSKMITFFKQNRVSAITFTGGISRPKLLKTVSPDFRTLQLIARLGTIKDDVFLRGVVGEFQKEGIETFSSATLLPESLAVEGTLTRRTLTDKEYKDARIGWEAAKLLGKLDCGQAVVVADTVIVALEGIDGTDATIRRGGELTNRGGCVVVKVAKPQQDTRLDLPSIGIKTIESMKAAGATALVLEHERALILSPDQVINAANAAGIAIAVLKSD